jgi:uncharacterized protein
MRLMRGPRTHALLAPLGALLLESFPADAGDKPIVAVFDIENRGTKLGATELATLSDYLATEIASTGAFETVPRDEIKRRLETQKKDSYRACYAQSCQIELGQELAAQKSLSTQVMRLGKMCLVTATLFDLRRSIAEHGATADGSCEEDAIVAEIKQVVQKLVHPPFSREPPASQTIRVERPGETRAAAEPAELDPRRPKNACESGKLEACVSLGDAYRKGFGGNAADDKQAAALYKKACDGGSARGCFSYGWMLKYGAGVDQSSTSAVRALERACDLDDLAGCTELALSYETGQGVQQSSARAYELYRKACDGNYAWGCGGAGWMAKYGHGTAVDYETAGAMLERACAGGDMGGCSELAGLHQAGLGRAQNSKRAIELYAKSCEGGWAFGCGGLGWMYKYGYGVPLDYTRANHFLQSGCDKGDYGACHELASLYKAGTGVRRDDVRAAGLLKLACQHGFRESCRQVR